MSWKRVWSWCVGLSALFTLSCVSSHSPLPEDPAPKEEPPDLLHRAVWIEIPVAPYSRRAGTGVVIFSSNEIGTFILTNLHVVSFRVDDTTVSIPRVIYLKTSNGEALETQVVAAGPIDAALLWSPRADPRGEYHTLLSTRTEYEPGEQLDIISFCPQPFPYTHLARFLGEVLPPFPYGLQATPDIIAGNSGSAIYDAREEIVGLIWGATREPIVFDAPEGRVEANVGLFVPVFDIRRLFDENGLAWLLTPTTADDMTRDGFLKFFVLGYKF